jgi:hypothetical protein
MPPKHQQGMDERFFDQEYVKTFKESQICFVYCVCGRSFDQNRQNVCPYTSIAGEQRLLINPDGVPDIRAFASDEKHARTTRAHIDKLVDCFECTFGRLEGSPRAKIA